MAAPAPRLFLTFDPSIECKIVNKISTRVLYEPRKVVHTIDSLVSLIAEDFGIPATQNLCLSVNGYAAPSQGPASLLRNNDIVTVASTFTNAKEDWKIVIETAIRNAVAAEPSQGVLSSVLAAAHAGATEVHPHPILGKAGKIIAKSSQMPGLAEKLSKPTKKRARADANGAAAISNEPSGLQRKKKRISSSKKQAVIAAAPEEPTAQPMPVPAVKHVPGHALPVMTNGGGCADGNSDESDDSQEPGAEGKGPSRSARRKKLKRQLRRQGLLDSAHKQAVPDGRTTAAAGRASRVEESPAAPLALPKRGEAWARSRADMQFMQEGHVYFTDSDLEEGQPGGDNRSRTLKLQHLQQPTPVLLPGPPPMQPRDLHGKAPLDNGHVSHGDSHQQHFANGHQEPTMVPARHKSAPVTWPKVQTPAVDTGPLADAEFEALPKPEPHVMEGDVIAYRLLHIGDDWTPQVSEWRKGRVTSLEEPGHVLTVEPWPNSSVHPVLGLRQPSPAAHDTWQHGTGEESDEEEEQPPSDYTEDGVLVTASESFSDIRLIHRAIHAPETGAAQCGSDPAQPAKSTGEAFEGVSDSPIASVATGTGDADRGLSSAPQNGHAGLQLASGPPNPGPPTPGGAMVPSIGAWAELAAELKRRREELATKQSSPAQAASLSPSSHLSPGGRSASTGQGPQQPSANGVSAKKPLLSSQAGDTGAAAVSGEPDQAAQERMQSGSVAKSAVVTGGSGDESPMQLIGSGIGTPGASKPRPGVRSSAIGPLLARLRREAAED
ncbi:g4168 [Coccomyxa elongata]